ncbi:dUTP diphosphatase [Soehngenia saccharolytica]|nr:dUTP diphosphatase [Soehngenia saccharolytica]
MQVKIVNKSSNNLPEYKTVGAAGLDLCAYLSDPIVINPFERVLIPTGLFLEIPNGYEAQIRGRSGLALNHGITLANGIGTIDSDYRGEIKIILINLGNEPFIVNNGDRVAQMIFTKYERADLIEVDEINETKRGENGFGHTGI